MGRRSMENAGWCRAIARDFMRLAHSARTPQARVELLDKAWTWARLAEEPAGYGDSPAGSMMAGNTSGTALSQATRAEGGTLS